MKILFSRRKLSWIARFCHTKGRHASSFMEKTFAYSHKTVKFAKVSRYTVPHEPAIAMACIDFYCGIISEQVFIRISVYCGRTSDCFSTIHAITQELPLLDVLYMPLPVDWEIPNIIRTGGSKFWLLQPCLQPKAAPGAAKALCMSREAAKQLIINYWKHCHSISALGL